SDRLAANGPACFCKGEHVGQTRAGMLGIGERINGRNPSILGELFNIALGKSPDHRPVDHSTEHSSRIFDRFSAAELEFVCAEKNPLPPKLANANFKGKASESGRIGKEYRPGMVG